MFECLQRKVIYLKWGMYGAWQLIVYDGPGNPVRIKMGEGRDEKAAIY